MRSKSTVKNTFIFNLITAFLIIALSAELSLLVLQKFKNTAPAINSSAQKEIEKSVLPPKTNLGISFNDTVTKMVQFGVIDKEKFLEIYKGNKALTEEAIKLLDSPSFGKITATQENSPLLLNILWALGIANKTDILTSGPMGQYKSDVGNFASTGGWTLGKQDGAKLFNKYQILSITPEQESMVKEIAGNIYRPCCNNSTYFPDCNHGAAMLAFLELAASQGISKSDIYKKALILNSYWFPETYTNLAIYFKKDKNISWDKIDPKIVLGSDYSSAQGYLSINKKLQAEGLLPQIKESNNCGV